MFHELLKLERTHKAVYFILIQELNTYKYNKDNTYKTNESIKSCNLL